MIDIFKAIADPTRREILLSISQEPSPVNTLAEKFQMSRPAVSKHIRILERHGLLVLKSTRADGRQRVCYPQLEALVEVETYIRQLEDFWKARLGSLGDFLDQEADETS